LSNHRQQPDEVSAFAEYFAKLKADLGRTMARIPRIGSGWDPATKVLMIVVFAGSFVYLACMANATVNTWVQDAIGINFRGQ